MKIRWTSRSLRVRLDDLEVAALLGGETLETRLEWPGGGWCVRLDPAVDGVQAEGADIRIGLASVLGELADPRTEGVRLGGPPRVDVEKDYRPAHLN